MARPTRALANSSTATHAIPSAYNSRGSGPAEDTNGERERERETRSLSSTPCAQTYVHANVDIHKQVYVCDCVCVCTLICLSARLPMRMRACKYTWPGSNWRPSACEADVIATRPQVHVAEVRAAGTPERHHRFGADWPPQQAIPRLAMSPMWQATRLTPWDATPTPPPTCANIPRRAPPRTTAKQQLTTKRRHAGRAQCCLAPRTLWPSG